MTEPVASDRQGAGVAQRRSRLWLWGGVVLALAVLATILFRPVSGGTADEARTFDVEARDLGVVPVRPEVRPGAQATGNFLVRNHTGPAGSRAYKLYLPPQASQVNAEPLPLVGEAFQDDHGIALGSRVTVAAESFGPEHTEGVLRAATRTRLTLERQDERAGTVHVHFPRIGFVLKEVRA